MSSGVKWLFLEKDLCLIKDTNTLSGQQINLEGFSAGVGPRCLQKELSLIRVMAWEG